MKALKAKKRVFVGISGGVDSSVVLALLKKRGYDVVGVFIKTWQPDFIECTWRDDRRDAMRVCAVLNVPFYTLDLTQEYKEGVAHYMIEEYARGRTPNPDVMCNREVKFGGFLKFALANGADYVATGHYAIVKQKGEKYILSRGKDTGKDQSYFLWTLTNNELSKVLFPIGDKKKSTVRALAKKFNLPTALKKDSQGVCFLGPLDMKEFLTHYLPEKEGVVVNDQNEVVGKHTGAHLYTLGERHGFTITKNSPTMEPYYIVAKDIDKNILTVSHKKPEQSIFAKKEYLLEKTNWIHTFPIPTKKYRAQIRYHGELYECVITKVVADTVSIVFKQALVVAPGQSVVFYNGTTCLGGGVVVS
jgi:tRNA-specific 2-thiouridylase